MGVGMNPTHAPIDLRSDTVTRPTPAMRRAMAEAEVGDDLFGDDPTVNRLQDRVAELTGRPAALFLPTGTLCNEIAMHVYARPGHLVVCEESAHTGDHEVASAAALSGLAFKRIRGDSRGRVTPAQVAAAVEPEPYYGSPVVDLVTLENTHQIGGGSVLTVDGLRAVSKVCADRGVPLYLDGARIFNACTVTGSTIAEYASEVDALMFCLSKGLGAPIGSMLVGEAEFISAARRAKVLMGAGWRQAGVLAAAGMVALDEGPGRLGEDHENARRLAEGVAEIVPGGVDVEAVATNIVFVDISGTGRSIGDWVAALAAQGLLVTVVAGKARMLTHRDVSADGIDAAVDAWRRAAETMKPL
jgi:threonine aldolase